ncbi:MAG: hypothetical protein ACAI38_03710 [Myxococcota bacterium]
MRHFPLILASCVLATAAACGDGTPEVRMALAVRGTNANGLSAAVTATAGAGGLALEDGANTILITSAEIVLEEIELKRTEASACPEVGDADDDSCEKFETGPRLVALPLDGKVTHELATVVPTGSYDELEFEIHKLEGSGGSDILRDRPDLAGLSMRVAGTYNGTPFVFVSEESQELELELSPPLVVDADGSDVNLTLSVDLAAWFTTGAGLLVNPTVQSSADIIDNNIDQSFECFEDDDHDGSDD